jgi:hypothetical protein
MFDLDVFRTPEVVPDLSTYDRFVIAFSGGKDIGGPCDGGEVQHVVERLRYPRDPGLSL